MAHRERAEVLLVFAQALPLLFICTLCFFFFKEVLLPPQPQAPGCNVTYTSLPGDGYEGSPGRRTQMAGRWILRQAAKAGKEIALSAHAGQETEKVACYG